MKLEDLGQAVLEVVKDAIRAIAREVGNYVVAGLRLLAVAILTGSLASS